jgi:hypothetical protein
MTHEQNQITEMADLKIPCKAEHELTKLFRLKLVANDTKQQTTQVVRLRRKGGVVVQDCDIYIGRRLTQGGWDLPTSKWHNPYAVKKTGSVTTAEQAVKLYEEYMRKPEQANLIAALPELVSKRLGCWCKNKGHEPCHGDVLIKLLKEKNLI